MGELQEKNFFNKQSFTQHGLEIREYQVKIAQQCIDKNSLVVLPTGLGKTIIAVLVSSEILKKFPPESKIIVLAPTRPLINQHYDTFLKYLKIAEDQYAILTGKTLPDKRQEIFQTHQILFYTPQTLRNDLVNKKYTLNDTALLVIDEAHHASGDYPYPIISDIYVDHNPDGIILALTASPGSSKKKIETLCSNLHIPLENIHIRTRKDEDVATYIKPMDIYKIGVDLTPLMEGVYHALTIVLEERLHYLSQLNFLEQKGEHLHTKIIRKDLLKLNTELVSLLQSNGDKTGVYSALSINAQALIVYHMLELVEQQGLNILLDYIEKLKKEAHKKSSSKANKILAADQRLHAVHMELRKNAELSPENLIHPKYPVLVKIIQEELRYNPQSRILVFIKLRDSVKNIVKNLKEHEIIKTKRFVGQATKGQDDKGLTQKQQIEILDKFKNGTYNTLVGTNVAEEGLDIAECDLVIFYDVVASEIRYIQRKGRTARHREGKVVILYCKGTRDEMYLKIALSKLTRMNITLKNPQQFKESCIRSSRSFLNSGEIPKEQKIEKPKINVEKSDLSSSKKQYQSNLESFLEAKIQKSLIQVSKYFPMKFGILKKLQEMNIKYDIVNSDLHLVLYNKVLVQIFTPSQIILDEFINTAKDLQQISSLFIAIVDFIDFKEDVEGAKKIFKCRLQEISQEHHIQIISIDNEEELFFILKSIITTTLE
ncbi:MAG: DEAD/DEAH box helicase [Candidatus Hermodarchaeota archaeon]